MMSALKLKFMNSSSFSRFHNGQSKSNSVLGEKYRKNSSETDSSASEDGNNNKKHKKYVDHQIKSVYNYNNSDTRQTMARANNRIDKLNTNKSNERPLFITTVKSGKFLDPPPELAYLFGLTQNCNTSSSSTNEGSVSSIGSNRKKSQKQFFLYSFSSQPRVLNQTHHKSRCETAAKAAAVTESSSENRSKPGNISDSKEARTNDSSSGQKNAPKYVARGSNFIPYPIPTNSESQTTRQQQARRRALARRRAQGGYIRLGTPPPVMGRHNKTIQTDIVFEEIYLNTLKSEVECQTELHQDSQTSETYIQRLSTEEAGTQINEGELFDSNAELEIMLPSFIEHIVEDSLVEVLEEEEEEALHIQQAFLKNKSTADINIVGN